jgi:hypothetical protein
MTDSKSRREFLKDVSKFGCGCALFMASGRLMSDEKEKIDLKKLNYCGYTCPEDCKMYRAGKTGDLALKKEAFKVWKIKERYGIEFDPDIVFCHRCKTLDKPLGIAIKKCTVRACAIEKKMESCVACSELKDCDKDLWKRFPTFYEAVKKMQVQYFKQISS